MKSEVNCTNCMVSSFKDSLCKKEFCEKYKAVGSVDDFMELIGRKTGKWIYDKYYAVHVCSECDEQALEEYTVNPRTLDRDYDEVLSNYCPHCGSRMIKVEDEEDEW